MYLNGVRRGGYRNGWEEKEEERKSQGQSSLWGLAALQKTWARRSLTADFS